MNTQGTDEYQPPDKDTKSLTESCLMGLGKRELNEDINKKV